MPPSDQGAGGDNLYDIYVRNLNGAAGKTKPDLRVSNPYPLGYSSWIEILNDSIKQPFPKFANLRATVAHEFGHACQFSFRLPTFDLNQFLNEAWFAENTSVYIEHVIYTDIYTLPWYFSAYNTGPLQTPGQSMFLHPYTGGLWPTFLDEYFDTIAVRLVWNQWATYGQTGSEGIFGATDAALQNSYGTTLDTALKHYSLWRYFTGARADTNHFKYASLYPTSSVLKVHASCYPVSANGFDVCGYGGAGFIEFLGPSGGLLNSIFNGGIFSTLSWTVFGVGVRAPARSIENEFVLNNNAHGSLAIPWAGNSKIALVIADLSNATVPTCPSFSYSGSLTGAGSVTFSNKIRSNNAGGKLLLNTTDTLSSGNCKNLITGVNHRVQTLNERFTSDSIYKHHDWDGVPSKYKMSDTFQVSSSSLPKDANFKSLNPVTIRNEIIGAPFVDGGTVEFKDPWYLNAAGNQPDSFIAFPSPLSPSGAYNQTTGGVFLNQAVVGGSPYYSVRTPLTHTIGNFLCTFIGWDASGADIVTVGSNPQGYDEKAIKFTAANAVVKAKYQATSATISTQLASQWNMVSVPDTVSNFLKTSVYPGAATSAFAYGATGYVAKDTLKNGVGYWVKYDSAKAVTHTGPPIFAATINVALGWNMIGSISTPIKASSVTYSPSNLQASNFFLYTTGYQTADSIKPGIGYWFKANGSGSIFLNAASTANNPPSASNAVPPDGPPSAPPAPSLVSPAEMGIGVGLPVAFSWDGNFSGDTYRLQVDNEASFSAPLVKDTSNITNTSCTLSGLAGSTTYYWRVLEKNTVGEGVWSDAWSFTTSSGIQLSWTTVNTHPQLTWTVPSGITSPYKVYRYDCVCGEGDCGGTGSLKYSGSSLTYTDNGVIVQGKFDDCASTSYYYVKGTLSGTSTLSGASNKVAVNNSNVSWKQGRPDVQAELPTETKLKNNYPNPFNPVTVINYALAEDLHVVLKVYDVLGQEVATLVDGFENAGYKSAQFNASVLPSGVYIYKFTAGSVTDVKKMLLIR